MIGVDLRFVKFNGTVMGVYGNNHEEELPFAIVRCRDANDKIFADAADLEGKFEMCLTAGEYDLETQCIGFKPYRQHILVIDSNPVVIKLQIAVCDDPEDMIIILDDNYSPPIEIGPDAATQKMEIDGVQVKVR